jgi:hypothetical protein
VLLAVEACLNSALSGSTEWITPAVGELENYEFGGELSSNIFEWPPSSLHILNLVNVGLAGRPERMPSSLQEMISRLLITACVRGQVHDRKWVLEVAGTAPSEVLLWMVKQAFQSKSNWLRETAYKELGRLARIPADIAKEVRRGLMTMSAEGSLRKDSIAVSAQLKRLDSPRPFLVMKRLLTVLPLVDAALHVVAVVVLLLQSPGRLGTGVVATWAFLSHLSFYLLRASPVFSWETSRSRLQRALSFLMSWKEPRIKTLVYTLFRGSPFAIIAFAVSRTMLVLLAGGWGRYSPAATWALCATLYSVTWALGGLYAVASGRFYKGWWWPLLQLAALASAAEVSMAASQNIYRKIRASRGRVILEWAGEAIAFAVFGGILAAIGWALDRFLQITLIVGGAVCLIFLLRALYGAIIYLWYFLLYDEIGDWLWFRQWIKGEPEVVSAEQLLELILRQHTTPGIARVLYGLRRRRLVPNDEDTIDVVSGLLLAAEYVARLGNQERGFSNESVEWPVFARKCFKLG